MLEIKKILNGRSVKYIFISHMERLIKDYIAYLSGDEPASTKFWEMEKRIKQDKKTPGVCIELRKGNIMFIQDRFG